MLADPVRYKRYEHSALVNEATEELCNLVRYRMSLAERYTALKNRATTIIDGTLPELVSLLSSAYYPTHRELLQHCATPEQVLDTDVRMLERILGGGRRAGAVRANQSRTTQSARQGICGRRVRLQDSRLRGKASDGGARLHAKSGQGGRKGAILPAGADEGQVAHRHPRHGRCSRLRHAGEGEIGDPRKFMGYADMDPTRNESGETVRSGGHMSKRGPGALRWALTQAAVCARKNDPYF